MSSDTQRVSIVFLTPRQQGKISLKYVPKPKSMDKILVQSSDTIEELLLQQQPVGKRHMTKENTLAFYFRKDEEEQFFICPAASGKVFKHGADMARATVASVNSALGIAVSKIVFVASTWQADVRAEMMKHFNINKPDFRDGWYSKGRLDHAIVADRNRVDETFDINCELMLESIVHSVVTQQHERVLSPGTQQKITFEDLFLVKLYTFAQWVQCVRYCGVTLERHAAAEGPDTKAPMKLEDLMRTPCSVCKLQSNTDSWFVRFNGDTRGPAAMASRWAKETKKVAACLEKIQRKETAFFRGYSQTMDNIIFTVVDADDAGSGDGLKTHSGGYKATVGAVRYSNVHLNWGAWGLVAYAVLGDPEESPKDIFNSDGSLKGHKDGNNFVLDKDIQDRVFVVNFQHSKTRNRFAQLKPGDLVLNGHTSVMSVSDDPKKSYEYAGGEALHGTIWEIVTGQTGGKDINALSIVPPTHSDQESLIEPGTEMRVLRVHCCPHASHAECKADKGACPHVFKDYIQVQMLINLNNANELDLMRLPQVALARSFKIFHAVKNGGGFKDRHDFGRRVKGFGTGSSYWLPLSQYVTFGPESGRHVETESERYDRIMTTRQQCERVASMATGPGSGHPWGEDWTPYNPAKPNPKHPWNTPSRTWNGNLHGSRNAIEYELSFPKHPECEKFDAAIFGRPDMTNVDNYKLPGYTTPPPDRPSAYVRTLQPTPADAMEMSDQEEPYEAIDFDRWFAEPSKSELAPVTPAKVTTGSASLDSTPVTARKVTSVKLEGGRNDLDLLLAKLGIDLTRLRNAAGDPKCSESRGGLNVEHIEAVLLHFQIDHASGLRADKVARLKRLLSSLGVE